MDARTGKKIRYGRLVDPDSQRGVIVAYSHSVLFGPIAGGGTSDEVARNLAALQDANGIILGPGVVRLYEDAFVGRDRPALIVHADWQNWDRPHLRPAHGAATAIVDVALAAAAGVDALMSYLYIGHDDAQLERQEIARNAALAQQCDRHGMVLIIEPRSVHEFTDPALAFADKTVTMYCRIAAELGADIVKCLWPRSQDVLAHAIATCPAPVFLAGGPNQGGHEATFALAQAAIEAGARGLIFGRRAFEHDQIPQVMAGLKDIVQRGCTTEQALQRLGQAPTT